MPCVCGSSPLSVGITTPCGNVNEAMALQNGLPAFPEATGFGGLASGGRLQPVFWVTNLNDSGAGSLRQAITDCVTNGGGNVLFNVDGTITVTSGNITVPSNTTVWGESAPGMGIQIKNGAGFQNTPFRASGQNIIVRNIRSRSGLDGGGPTDNNDAFGVGGSNSSNIMIYKCSFMWATDEVFEVFGTINGSTSVTNVTLQDCIVAKGLRCPTPPIHSETCHGYGTIILGKDVGCITMHQNLFADSFRRHPRVDIDFDRIFHFEGNVIYNETWEAHMGLMVNTHENNATDGHKSNFIKNYYQVGGGGNPLGRYEVAMDNKNNLSSFRIHAMGNIGPHRANDTLAENLVLHPSIRPFWQATPYATCSLHQERSDATAYFNHVISAVGANWQSPQIGFTRDSIDNQIRNEVLTFTGGLIDDPSDMGGYPTMTTASHAASIYNGGAGDGVPDSYKIGIGVSTAVDAAATLHPDNDGYTILEKYMFSLN